MKKAVLVRTGKGHLGGELVFLGRGIQYGRYVSLKPANLTDLECGSLNRKSESQVYLDDIPKIEIRPGVSVQ